MNVKTLAAAIILILLVAVFYAFNRSPLPLIDQLQNPDYARGAITFIVAAVVVCLALILIMGGLFLEASAPDEVEERFRRGREVLAPFVGILGTIVGFYFGSADNGGAAALDVSALASPTEVTVRVSGGSEPYRVSLFQDGKSVFGPEPAEHGWMRVPLAQIKVSGEMPQLVIEASDARNHKARRELALGVAKSAPSSEAAPSGK